VRILVISNLYPPHYLGGYEVLCAQVVEALRGRGHDVTVLTSTHGVGSADGGEAEPSSVRRALGLYLPFDEPGAIRRWARRRVGRANFEIARRTLAEVSPDVTFVWSQLRLTVAPARAAEATGRAVVYALNDENIASYLPARFSAAPRGCVAYCLDRWLMPEITLAGLRLRHATSISEQVKRNLLARGVPVASARVIYQGIPLPQFPPKGAPGDLHDPARILYVGQLHAYKGVHTLIEAVRLLAAGAAEDGGERCPALEVTIVGEGPQEYAEALRGQAARVPVPIRFTGRVPHAETPALYRAHDLFVFPSTWQEPFGLTHLEAMASGTPVISTADGGHGEFLEDGVNALVFRKEDARQLAALLLRLLRDAPLRRRLALTARDVVAARFTVDRYVTDLEAFLVEARQEAEA
jgi:glycosyltransferase involved in cell wall biosynthesis